MLLSLRAEKTGRQKSMQTDNFNMTNDDVWETKDNGPDSWCELFYYLARKLSATLHVLLLNQSI